MYATKQIVRANQNDPVIISVALSADGVAKVTLRWIC